MGLGVSVMTGITAVGAGEEVGAGVGVAVGAGDAVGDGLGVAVGAAVGAGVAVCVGVGLAVGEGTGVGVSVGVGVGEGVGVAQTGRRRSGSPAVAFSRRWASVGEVVAGIAEGGSLSVEDEVGEGATGEQDEEADERGEDEAALLLRRLLGGRHDDRCADARSGELVGADLVDGADAAGCGFDVGFGVVEVGECISLEALQ